MALASLAGSAATGLVNATVNDPMSRGRAVCNQFYGHFSRPSDCSAAIAQMTTGADEVVYAVDGRSGKLHIPQAIKSGDCMIQIEMAGGRVPATISLVPDEVRSMASWLSTACTKDGGNIGGFVTGSLTGMAGWLTSPEGELDKPMPLYTSFLTVTVSTPFPEYISPGNYDPTMAYIFSISEFKAASIMPPASRMATNLRRRGERLLRQQKVMEPRGRRIAWWENPDRLDLPTGEAGGNMGIETARRRRRRGRRNGVVEEIEEGVLRARRAIRD
ncbi:MAG: hypothetical protein Q9220_007385 [cf. Caloplaca sp. 1 TL-2023]